jgi:predicted Zn-dependent peptidase
MDEITAHIEAVTSEEVQQVAQEFFVPESVAVTILGNLSGMKLTRKQMFC